MVEIKQLELNQMLRIVNDKGDIIYVKKVVDETPPNPRDEDSDGNLGIMVCWHHKYALGNDHSWNDVDDFFSYMLKVYCGVSEEKLENMSTADARNILENSEDVLLLPLYLLAHSGLAMQTHPFNDAWDSAQVGWIYTTKAQAQSLWDVEVGEDWKQRAREELTAEVEKYDDYLRGNTYGVNVYVFCGTKEENEMVEEQLKNKPIDPSLFDWFEEEQYCGFIGNDDKASGLLDFVNNIVA